MGEQRPEWAPRTRASAIEALTRLLPLLVPPTAPPPPAGFRAYLRAWLPPDGADADPASDAAAWLRQWSLQLGQLSRSVLATVDQALGVGDDGAPLSPSTAGRLRKVSRACIRRAVDLEVLEADVSFDEPGEPKTGPRSVPFPRQLVEMCSRSRCSQSSTT